MEASKPTTASAVATPPESVVSEVMKEGFETIAIQTGAGIGLGFMAGLVLARGGAGGSARKLITGFGGGVGLGSAWTRCSIQLEEALGTNQGKK
ncbi:expressed unknown protein [Seminavis robusta]|uniref:Uncharacterized protein n=1 Tax=Seminavis robusta TaxID=568900 RepID=A0A9N8HIQ4_9STRA|nr:expressed unknown protein [Seminavis robusta]|eukprot:Sro713_g191550.1 n/a (94) ;mRNA; f:17461-17742